MNKKQKKELKDKFWSVIGTDTTKISLWEWLETFISKIRQKDKKNFIKRLEDIREKDRYEQSGITLEERISNLIKTVKDD